MNMITFTTHGIVLVTTLKALAEKVANIGLFLEKMGIMALKLSPNASPEGPGQG